MKEFNVTGLCVPNMHYMVDTSAKLAEIKTMIDAGKYFAINRGRQYGKTTILGQILQKLSNDYFIVLMTFEDYGDAEFSTESSFITKFSEQLANKLQDINASPETISAFTAPLQKAGNSLGFTDLSDAIKKLCKSAEKKIVILIDEVDQSAGYKVFLKFLGTLRNAYLARSLSQTPAFQSVVLASVYDIRNLKLKLRPDEMHQYNSPWNIASDFDVDMSFNPAEIATMLHDYENDHHTGMDIQAVCAELHRFTNGYPYLVSALCKIIDEKLNKDWQVSTVNIAVKQLLNTRNTLFDDLTKKVSEHKGLSKLVYRLLILGEKITFEAVDDAMDLGIRFGILNRFDNGVSKVGVSNCIFETWLYRTLTKQYADDKLLIENKNESLYLKNGILSMETVLQKFAEFIHSEHRDSDEKFVEQNARLLFLSFLKPIINGTGSYYVEAETRDYQRMDVAVFYERKEYIIELKIWHGEKMNNDACDQLCGYLDSRRQNEGYLLNFCFNKNTDSMKDRQTGWLEHCGKRIFTETVYFS